MGRAQVCSNTENRRTETGNGVAWDGTDTGVFVRCDDATVKEVLQREGLLFLCPFRHDRHVGPGRGSIPRPPGARHETTNVG